MRSLAVLLLLIASSCSSPSAPTSDSSDFYPWSSVRVSGPVPTIAAFLAPSDGDPSWLRSVIIVTNPSPLPVQLNYGPCDFGLRLYPNDRLSGAPVWDNRTAGCDAIMLWLEIPAGETRVKPVFGFLSPSVLYDSLPQGRYYAAVTWRSRPEGRVRIVPAGEIRIGSSHSVQ